MRCKLIKNCQGKTRGKCEKGCCLRLFRFLSLIMRFFGKVCHWFHHLKQIGFHLITIFRAAWTINKTIANIRPVYRHYFWVRKNFFLTSQANDSFSRIYLSHDTAIAPGANGKVSLLTFSLLFLIFKGCVIFSLASQSERETSTRRKYF